MIRLTLNQMKNSAFTRFKKNVYGQKKEYFDRDLELYLYLDAQFRLISACIRLRPGDVNKITFPPYIDINKIILNGTHRMCINKKWFTPSLIFNKHSVYISLKEIEKPEEEY